MVKNLPANAGDLRDVGSIPGLGRSPKVGNGKLLQYSCLGNRTDKGAWTCESESPRHARALPPAGARGSAEGAISGWELVFLLCNMDTSCSPLLLGPLSLPISSFYWEGERS